MADIALVLETRADRGSAASRRLRAIGKIPAVVYGHGDEPLSVTVDARELRGALAASTRGSVLFDLVLGSERHLAIAREIQRHPVRHTVAHVDFQVVGRDEVVPADVPVVLVGEALGVTRQDGTVDHALLSLHLRAKPADIPTSIEVDISDLAIGAMIRVGDLKLPAGLIVEIDPETPVVVAQAPRGRDLGEGEVEGDGSAASTGEPGATEAAGES